MADYLHGAYGQVNTVGTRVPDEASGAIVYIGTAPVHTIAGGGSVNTPVKIGNMSEARRFLGYSDDWAAFSLCEAMRVHFEEKGVGPLVFINVLDPEKHCKKEEKTASKTPSDGSFTISDAADIDLDSITVGTKVEGTDYTVAYNTETAVITVTEKTAGALGSDALTVTYAETKVNSVSKTPSRGVVTIASASEIILDSVAVATKVKGTDYAVAYNADKETITISEMSAGALGSSALTITYKTVDPSLVTESDVIGSSDGAGKNTGLYAVKNVYQLTGMIPAFLAAPGFSSIPAVHAAMHANSVKINGHWDAYMFVDLPIVNGGTPITLNTAAAFKAANGYTFENETVYFPLAQGTDGKIYHLSTLAAANFQELLLAQDGIPYRTASNTACGLISNLYLGAGYEDRVYDDSLINEILNKNGIASAVYTGGRWAIWGAHSADYSQDNATLINLAETNRMMLYYVSNDFQSRRSLDVDEPITINDLKSIISDEQARLDALVNIGALTYAKVSLNADSDALSDIYSGDWSFCFSITTTPLAKSMTAVVNWTKDGFATYFIMDDAA